MFVFVLYLSHICVCPNLRQSVSESWCPPPPNILQLFQLKERLIATGQQLLLPLLTDGQITLAHILPHPLLLLPLLTDGQITILYLCVSPPPSVSQLVMVSPQNILQLLPFQ